MNRLILLVITIVGFGQLAFTQTPINDSTEAYNYWAQRGVIEMVYAYMQDYQKSTGRLTPKEEIGMNLYNKRFIDNLNNANLILIEEKFDSVSSFLENNDWNSCDNNIYQPLKKQIDNFFQLNENFFLNCNRKDKNNNDIPIDFIAKLDGTDNNEREYWNLRAETVIDEYESVLSDLSSIAEAKQTEKEVSRLENNLSSNEISNNPNNYQSETNFDFYFFQLEVKYLYPTLFIVISLIIGFFLGRGHVLRKTKKEINKILNNNTNEEHLGYSFSIDVNKLKQKNNDLEKSNKFISTDNNIEMADNQRNLRFQINNLKEIIEKNKNEVLFYIDEINYLKKKFPEHISANDYYPPLEEINQNLRESGSNQNPLNHEILLLTERKGELNNMINIYKSILRDFKQRFPWNTPDYNSSEQIDTDVTDRYFSDISSKEVLPKTEVRTQDHTRVYTPTKNVKKIFFSMPENNGSFQMVNGQSSNDGKKYFRIEYNESSNQGELFFLSSDRDQRAINRLESYLKPVCDIENISNSTAATKISLIQSGRVSLMNDTWVIDPNNKIKIKLY